jgi:hypothetical protein
MSTSKEGTLDRREFIAGAGAFALGGRLPAEVAPAELAASSECFTAAYYFGNYHVDPRNEKAHGPRWTEWNLVRAATPRFPGHHQPKIPLWGYEDESDPQVFEKKIAAAHANKLNALIFDWYWYKDGPFLNAPLERGYLGASNNKNLKFALMWANHDWYDIQPAKLDGSARLQFAGAVSLDTFNEMSDKLLKLFQHPSHLTIEGAPYFSIYEIYRFIEGMGGVRQAAAALDMLRSKARAIGLPGVHLNAVTWGNRVSYGQSRAVVVWSRLIFPDGSSVDLDGMVGHDASGAAGFHDQVDNHFVRLVSMALMLSAFTAGVEMSQPQGSSASGALSPSAAATQALGQQFGQLGMEVTRKNLNIQPTVKIRPGYRFNVRVNRDIAFTEPYGDSRAGE